MVKNKVMLVRGKPVKKFVDKLKVSVDSKRVSAAPWSRANQVLRTHDVISCNGKIV